MALAADPKKAVGMQAYMKSTMPYYGLNLLAVRRVSRQVFGDMEMGCLEWRGTPLVRKWSTHPNLWKRRVSIICQLKFKRETDLDLLYSNIEPNLADRDFFIRKAIGWALRQYAWTDPQEVARYVRAHDSQLSGLSRREALKNIG